MKQLLIIFVAILMACSFASCSSQRSKTKGFNYQSHSKSNAKSSRSNAKKFKAAGGDYTKMKCKRRKSKNRRR